mmetsp:Transcript_1936/g.3531  ORF Transcript_1936/g.3531 Transcript_1936/m.3531 type:complete len:172 (-) Transcript_1936:61-576(-)
MRILRIIILLSFIISLTHAQFGINKIKEKDIGTVEQNIQQGKQEQQEGPLTKLTEQDAVDIGALIEAAGEDPDTIKLVAALKDENSQEIDELKQLPQEEILNGLKAALDELKLLDVLFKDHAKALEAFEAEGLIPPQHLEKYRKDPSLLENDTRKSLYFQFVSLAVVGGYL